MTDFENRDETKEENQASNQTPADPLPPNPTTPPAEPVITQAAQPVEPVVTQASPVEKKSKKGWIIGCSIGAVLILVFLCIACVLVSILIPMFSAAGS